MAKGDTSSQLPGSEFQSAMNPMQKFFSTLGGNAAQLGGGQINSGQQQGGSIGPSNAFLAMNPMQRFFQTIGGGGTPTASQPYTQSAQQASPIQPTNPQNIAATFFKNLGAY